MNEVVPQHGEDSGRFLGREVVRTDPVDDGIQFLVGGVDIAGLVTLPPEFLHLPDGHAEDEDILLSDLLADLHIGTVQGADGQRAVERELHVPGSGGLLAGRGDLLGEVGGRHDPLGERDAVVRQEDHLEPVVDPGVGVDPGGNGIDGLDDVLGQVVAGRGLGGEDEDAGRDVGLRVLEEAAVEGQDMEQVEMLALVLVEALDLDVKEGGRVHVDPAFALDDAREVDLVRMLHGHEPLLELRISGIRFQPAQLSEITFPTPADLGADECAQARIAGKKPAARSDAVGLVVEFSGIKRVELGEEIPFEQLGVKSRDSVDGMASDNREVCHADHLMVPLLNEGEMADLLHVTGPHPLHLHQEVFVDLENDLKMARQDLVEETDAPFLERLGHQGVVRVGEGPRHDPPGLVPGHSVLVVQDSLEFDHGDRRVGVVELDGDLLGERLPAGVVLAEAADDVLERAGHEEILLDEAEFLSALVLVIGVENLGNGLAEVLLPHRLLITTAVEGLEVEFLGCLRFPQAEVIDRIGPVSGDRDIVGNTGELFRVDPLGDGIAEVIEDVLHAAVEFDFGGVLGTDDLPRRAVFHPVIGKFHLIPVAELLLEEAVLVMDAVADGGQVEGRQGVEKAGGQAAQPAVAEPHVVLLAAEHLDVQTEFPDGGLHVAVDGGAVKVVDVEASHQELEGEVIKPPGVLAVMPGLGGDHPFDDDALDGLGGGQPPVPLRRGLRITRQSELEVALDEGLESGDGCVDAGLEFGGFVHVG